MKYVLLVVTSVLMSACGTFGGAVSGAGDDLKTVGGWIKKQGS